MVVADVGEVGDSDIRALKISFTDEVKNMEMAQLLPSLFIVHQ